MTDQSDMRFDVIELDVADEDRALGIERLHCVWVRRMAIVTVVAVVEDRTIQHAGYAVHSDRATALGYALQNARGRVEQYINRQAMKYVLGPVDRAPSPATGA